MSTALFNLFGMISMKGVDDVTKNLTKIDKEVRKVQREMSKFGKSVETAGKKLTKAFTVPLAGMSVAIVRGIKDASDLSETVAKTGEIFGESASDIDTWAKSADKALGQSKTQAMDAAATFGIFGKSAGLAGNKLTSFSTDFVELASDLASFNNTSPEEAIIAIGAALRGENEPIRRFGVLLDDASMRQEALKLGLIATTKEALEPQTKILAAQSLIYAQTTTAQGDFARTSGGLANQQRILMAEVENVSASLGEIFLPMALTVFGFIRDTAVPAVQGVVTWFTSMSEPMQNTITAWGIMLAAIGPVVLIIGKLIIAAKVLVPFIKLLTFSQAALNSVMLANPIGLVIAAMTALVAVSILLYNNWETVSAFLESTWNSFVELVVVSVSHLKQQFFNVLAMYLKLAENMTSFIPFLGNKVSDLKNKFISLAKQEKASRMERNKATKETDEAMESMGDYRHTIGETTENVKVLGEHESQLAKQRNKLEKEWTEKFLSLTRNREQALQAEKDKAIAEAERVGANTENIENYYQALEDKRLQEVFDKKTEFEQSWTDKVFDLSASRVEKLNKEKEQALQDAEDIGAGTVKIRAYYVQQELAIEKEKQKAISEFQDARAAEYMDYLRTNRERDLQATMQATDNGKEWNAAHKELIETRQADLDEERELMLERADELGASKHDIESLYDDKLRELNKESVQARNDMEEKLLKNKVKSWQNGLQAFGNLMNQIGGIVNGRYKSEIEIIEEKKKKQIAAIKTAKMREGEKAKAIQALEEATYDKVRAIKKKQAKQDKKMAIFNVIIASALAIMKVAASAPGFFIRIASIIAITALGIAQIAAIKRRPIPSFAKGAVVKGGRGGIQGEIGEGTEDELIFPLKTGVDMLFDRLISKVEGFKSSIPMMSTGGLNTPGGNTINLNVGTLIADDNGIKKLERSMRKFRIQEDQRRGL